LSLARPVSPGPVVVNLELASVLPTEVAVKFPYCMRVIDAVKAIPNRWVPALPTLDQGGRKDIP
jgi:hypothetical protein